MEGRILIDIGKEILLPESQPFSMQASVNIVYAFQASFLRTPKISNFKTLNFRFQIHDNQALYEPWLNLVNLHE